MSDKSRLNPRTTAACPKTLLMNCKEKHVATKSKQFFGQGWGTSPHYGTSCATANMEQGNDAFTILF